MPRSRIRHGVTTATALGAAAALALTAFATGATAKPVPRVSAVAPAGLHPDVNSN